MTETMTLYPAPASPAAAPVEDFVLALIGRMTLEEKIGQLQQLDASGDPVPEALVAAVRAGRVGAVINRTDPVTCNALQRAAVEQSRLGIPLLMGRDVIHGFRTIAPIPLGQAASWNPDLVREAAMHAAHEARGQGVHWTFSPMIDIARDPRWGRIAEGFGEDPYLTGVLGQAMIEGYQGAGLDQPGTLAACVKHFVGYGASEAGRDYSTTNIPPNELANIYLEPFRMAVEAGVATLMTSFSDIDGIPATAHAGLLQGVLRGKWGFDGVVVSDWNAINELIPHGLCEGPREAALEAVHAGVDMEMAGSAYADHLANLLREGHVSAAQIDAMVERLLRLKQRLGLFERPYTPVEAAVPLLSSRACAVSRQLALESFVLLQNTGDLLPLDASRLRSLAVVGPLADAPHEQIGTWVFDGHADDTITPLAALRARFGEAMEIRYAPGLSTSRARSPELFGAAEAAVRGADVALVILGEESILSGEAHSRADIRLPGAQSELLERLRATGTPLITVILAGRPLVLTADLPRTDAVLYGWHPGTMGGPALVDLVFGDAVPVGKLPVTFPKSVGQIPIYYNHKNTGRPPVPAEIVLIDDIEVRAKQTSLGMSAFHLDDGYEPLFPFGFGLTYGKLELGDLRLSAAVLDPSETLTVTVTARNTGPRAVTETLQLYIRDVAASLTRPVRELKAFQRIHLAPGEQRVVRLDLTARDLAFHRRDGSFGAEAGAFRLWVGTSAAGGLEGAFTLR